MKGSDDKPRGVELLVCVVGDSEQADEVMRAFVEIGIAGATVFDTYGMGQVLVQDIPIFAGFRSLLAGSGSYHKTIFSVIPDPEKMNLAIAAIQRVLGDLSEPNRGIVFTVPVTRVLGLRDEA
jgi:nitrogen regulatory protein P-II 1